MKTALISDLHLGVTSDAGLLKRERFRAILIDAIGDADRLVLLGDTVELRDRPIAEALAEARPFFEQIGRALAGRTVVLVPGNHDHRLLGPWLDSHSHDHDMAIDLGALVPHPSPACELIAEWLGEAELEVRYPGVWIRPDIYATHGHYLDSHLTLPTIERLSIATIDRMRRREPGIRESPADYEHVHAPVYDLLFDLAQGVRAASSWTQDKQPSVRLWEVMGGATGRARTMRGRLLRSAVPLAISGLERARFGQFGRDFSLGEVGRAGVNAMHEVVANLGIDAEQVIFGHIHRRGPLANDLNHPAAAPRWESGGTRLWNTGSWVYPPGMLAGASPRTPFWPGSVITVGDMGDPELLELLADAGHAELSTESG